MEGWTGKDCPNCEGRGTVLDDYGYEVSCAVCGGTGHEWGEISDESDGWSPLTAKREAARGDRRPLRALRDDIATSQYNLSAGWLLNRNRNYPQKS
jgi:hypothetical protein